MLGNKNAGSGGSHGRETNPCDGPRGITWLLGVLVVPLLPNLDVGVEAEGRFGHLLHVGIPFLVDAALLDPLRDLVVRVVGDGGVVVLQGVGVLGIRAHVNRYDILDAVDAVARLTNGQVGRSDLVGVGVVDHLHVVANPATEAVLQGDGAGIRIFGVSFSLVDGVLVVAVIGDDIWNRAEESSHGKLLAVHGVDHLVDGVLVGCVRVDGQAGTGVGPAAGVLGIIPLDLGVGRGGVLLQRRQGDVLVAKRVAVFGVVGPTEGDAGQRGLAVTDGLRSVLRGVAGEHILRDKALGHESVQVETTSLSASEV